MKRVYLVRHGETENNVAGLLQDHSPKLTLKGKRQADLIANRLINLNFQHLIASDYVRAQQTAESVEKATGVKVQSSELFREIRKPSVFFHQPRTSEEFVAYMKEEFEQYGLNEDWKYGDEESYTEAKERINKAFTFLKSLNGDVVVVSHGHFIRRMLATVAVGGDLDGITWQKMYRNFHATNTGITTLQYNEETNHWNVLTFNDHAHFADN